MKNLRDEINEVINSGKIVGISFLRLNEWEWILEKLANVFLSNGKQSLGRIWLWDSIKEPYISYQPNDGLIELEAILSDEESYWFIASDEDGKYWVLDGTGASIISLLSETRYFEYYVTDKKVTWLVCENHHGVMILKGNVCAHGANA